MSRDASLDPAPHRAPLGRLRGPVAANACPHGDRADAGTEQRDGQPDRARAKVTTGRDAPRHDADHCAARPAPKPTHADDDEAPGRARIERPPDLSHTEPVAHNAETLANGPRGGFAAGTTARSHPAKRRDLRCPLLDVDVRMHDT